MPRHVNVICRRSTVSANGVAHRASRFAGRRVHFIGIGGCGMSGLAAMLLDAGAIVTGSEPKPNHADLRADASAA